MNVLKKYIAFTIPLIYEFYLIKPKLFFFEIFFWKNFFLEKFFGKFFFKNYFFF